MTVIRLRPGHLQPVWAGHPWVFSQAIQEVEGAPAAGDQVAVQDPKGQFLGRGYWSPQSAIPVRILTRDPDDPLDSASLSRKIEKAATWRRHVLQLPSEETTAYRLVHSEGDSLAGLIVDMYGEVAAVQLLTVGMKRRADEIFATVARVTQAKTVVEVASKRAQKLEGFESKTAIVRGRDTDRLRFRERGFDYEIDLEVMQKTGFYLDQRDNRATAERLGRDRRVLDAFCYVGPFSLAVARGGASQVLALDSSAKALATGATLAAHHGFGERIDYSRRDVRRALGELASRQERFDMVILDPPKLAPTASHLESGRRAYRKLNAAALRLVAPGGIVLSCSCSAAVQPRHLTRTLGLAARDAKREVTLLSVGEQGWDHPVPAAFPEGRYLKCATLLVH